MAYEEIVTSSRKINDKTLDADITLTAEDVGALSTSGGTMSGAIKFKTNAEITYSSSIPLVIGGGNTSLYFGKKDRISVRNGPDDGNLSVATPTDAYDAANKAYVDAVERPYLVTFTKGTGDNYTADKTLKEIYDAVQAGNYVYGYVNTNGYWAYIPLGSCFTTGTNTISYFIYFEGPLANGNGSMVARNKVIRYISLTGLNNADATSKQYKFVTYNAVPSDIAINKKALNTGDITLTPSDVGAQPAITANGFLKGDGSGNIIADKPVYIVNITSDGENGTSDKTIEEIMTAYTDGYTIQAILDENMILSLSSIEHTIDTSNITFSTSFYKDVGGAGYTATCNYNNNWQITRINIVPETRTINGKDLSADITLTAADVGAASLTGNQTISGDRTINSNISLASNNDSSNKLTVGIPTIFKNNVNFTNATVSGLVTAAVGTTTDYSIYIGSTAPAANTAPLIWIDTSASGVMKYRTSTTSTTWTAVPVAWG